MRLATMRTESGTRGVVVRDGSARLLDFEDAGAAIRAAADGRDLDQMYGGDEIELDEARLAPPVLQPEKIICVGLNYHAHAAEAKQRTQALRDRLAEKEFRNGRLYAKLKQPQAAAIYLRELIDDYPESRWSGDAAVLLADVLVKLGRKQEAIEALRRVPPSAPDEVKSRAADELRELGSTATP
jgi:tetratricopeptide (TPR) repeat protein